MRTLKSLRGLFIIGILIFPMNIFGQGACPACSNPYLPGSGMNNSSTDSIIPAGMLRVTMVGIQGFNFEGGHLNGGYLGYGGADSAGNKINVPLHTHVVELQYTRMEFDFNYAFKNNWTVELRTPYEIKAQTATTGFFDSIAYTQEHIDAIIRNRDLHHRNETYQGIADLRLFFLHRINGLFGKHDKIDIAFGTSIPTGKTEPNVLKLIAQGKKHLHIQFGTGTFDPLLELNYTTPLSKSFAMGGFATVRVSLYENPKEYKGPIEISGGINASYHINRWFKLYSSAMAFRQGYYYWDGVKDPNSGIFTSMAMLGANIKIHESLSLNTGMRYPVYQTTFEKNEEGPYKQGPTVLLEATHLFNLKKQ